MAGQLNNQSGKMEGGSRPGHCHSMDHSSVVPLPCLTLLRPKLIYFPAGVDAAFCRRLPTVERTGVEYVRGISDTRQILQRRRELFARDDTDRSINHQYTVYCCSDLIILISRFYFNRWHITREQDTQIGIFLLL